MPDHIKLIGDEQRYAARLRISGLSIKEVAAKTRKSPNTISVWFRSPCMKKHMSELQEIADKAAVEAMVKIRQVEVIQTMTKGLKSP